MFSTALVTPFPKYLDLSLSLNSSASNSPVDAPEGAFCNIEKDRMENTPDFFDLNLKLNYTFVLHDHIKLQLNAGVQNIFNSFQKDLDKGEFRDSGYFYGPTQPRTFFIGFKIMN